MWTLWKSLQAFQTISSPQQGQKFEGPALRDPRKRKHHDREHFGRNWMNENSCGDISLLKLGEGNTFCLDLNLSKHFYSSCHQNQYIFHHLQLSVHCTVAFSVVSLALSIHTFHIYWFSCCFYANTVLDSNSKILKFDFVIISQQTLLTSCFFFTWPCCLWVGTLNSKTA